MSYIITFLKYGEYLRCGFTCETRKNAIDKAIITKALIIAAIMKGSMTVLKNLLTGI